MTFVTFNNYVFYQLNNDYHYHYYYFKREKGWVSNLLCFLAFPKSSFAAQWLVLCMAHGLNTFLYEFTITINHGFF